MWDKIYSCLRNVSAAHFEWYQSSVKSGAVIDNNLRKGVWISEHASVLASDIFPVIAKYGGLKIHVPSCWKQQYDHLFHTLDTDANLEKLLEVIHKVCTTSEMSNIRILPMVEYHKKSHYLEVHDNSPTDDIEKLSILELIDGLVSNNNEDLATKMQHWLKTDREEKAAARKGKRAKVVEVGSDDEIQEKPSIRCKKKRRMKNPFILDQSECTSQRSSDESDGDSDDEDVNAQDVKAQSQYSSDIGTDGENEFEDSPACEKVKGIRVRDLVSANFGQTTAPRWIERMPQGFITSTMTKTAIMELARIAGEFAKKCTKYKMVATQCPRCQQKLKPTPSKGPDESGGRKHTPPPSSARSTHPGASSQPSGESGPSRKRRRRISLSPSSSESDGRKRTTPPCSAQSIQHGSSSRQPKQAGSTKGKRKPFKNLSNTSR